MRVVGTPQAPSLLPLRAGMVHDSAACEWLRIVLVGVKAMAVAGRSEGDSSHWSAHTWREFTRGLPGAAGCHSPSSGLVKRRSAAKGSG